MELPKRHAGIPSYPQLGGQGGRAEVSERVGIYISERVANGELAASSADVIGAVLHRWHRHVGYRPPTDWTPDDVRTFVHDQTVRPNTRKSRIGKLRPYVRWLARRGDLHADPTDGVGRIIIPPGMPRDFTDDEVGRLLAVCPDDRARLIVLVMVQLGLRCCSVAWMRVEDIDVRHRTLHVRGKGGRGEITHSVPVPTQAWDALEARLVQMGRSAGAVIESREWGRAGAPVSPAHVSKMVGRWVRAAGLKTFPYDGMSAHSLRHTFAQSVSDGGADPRKVQWAMGHATYRSTELYLRREPPGLREAIEGRTYMAA